MTHLRRKVARTLSQHNKPLRPGVFLRMRRKKYKQRVYQSTLETIGRFQHALENRKNLFVHGQIITHERDSIVYRLGENIISGLIAAKASARVTAPLGLAIGLTASPTVSGAIAGLIAGPLVAGGAFRVLVKLAVGKDHGLVMEYNMLATILAKRRLFIERKEPLTIEEIKHNQRVITELEEHLVQLDTHTREAIKRLEIKKNQ